MPLPPGNVVLTPDEASRFTAWNGRTCRLAMIRGMWDGVFYTSLAADIALAFLAPWRHSWQAFALRVGFTAAGLLGLAMERHTLRRIREHLERFP